MSAGFWSIGSDARRYGPDRNTAYAVLTTSSGANGHGLLLSVTGSTRYLLSHNIFKAKSQAENAQKKSRHMKSIGRSQFPILNPLPD